MRVRIFDEKTSQWTELQTVEERAPIKLRDPYDCFERSYCPTCYDKGSREVLYAGQKYCSVCGQKLARSEAEE